MTPKEILREHLVKSGSDVDPDTFIKRVYANTKLGARIVQSNNCLFLFKPTEANKVTLRIFNGGSSLGYAKALRSFIGLMRKVGVTQVQMNVADISAAKNVAKMAGVKSTSFSKNTTDAINPNTMLMEI